jgi:hypothetical protein
MIQGMDPGIWSTFRRILFLPYLLLTLAVMAVLQASGSALKNEAAPQGIVSYELAGNLGRTQAILDSWDVSTKQTAAFNLGLDFLFIFLYAPAIAMACIWAGNIIGELARPFTGLGAALGWGQILAGLLDVVENGGLILMLLNGVSEPWPAVSASAAKIKFILIGLGLLYAACGGFTWLIGRLLRKRADIPV